MLPPIEEIKIRRKRLGITQRELAEKAGVSQALIAKIEAGAVDPRYSTLKRIWEALQELEGERLTAEKVMNFPVKTVKPWEKVKEAVSIMMRYGYSQVPVVDKGVVGNLDEERVVKALGELGEEVLEKEIEEIMGPPLPTIPPTASIHLVEAMLSETPAILVVDKQGKLIGIITRADLLRFFRKGQKTLSPGRSIDLCCYLSFLGKPLSSIFYSILRLVPWRDDHGQDRTELLRFEEGSHNWGRGNRR